MSRGQSLLAAYGPERPGALIGAPVAVETTTPGGDGSPNLRRQVKPRRDERTISGPNETGGPGIG